MAYLTKAEYLARFDTAETVRLTDENGDGLIDDPKLDAALKAASDFVDAYAGGRYAVPFSPPPAVVKDLVADLARERLYTLHPNDEVTARADRARDMLKDAARGLVSLIGDSGRINETSADQAAVYSPPQFFSDSLLSSYRGRLQ